jgi:hypothetical protein
VSSGDEISFHKKELYQNVYNDMSVTLGDKCPSYSTAMNLEQNLEFRTGHLRTEDEERSRRPTQVTNPENIDAIHTMILDDQRISAKKDSRDPDDI